MKYKIRLKLSQLGCSWQLGLNCAISVLSVVSEMSFMSVPKVMFDNVPYI